jgi:ketosteroid isomerase-like protein
MVHENIEIIRRGLDAYNRGDVQTLLDISDPEAEFVPLRSLVVGGSYRGHDGIRKFMEDVSEEWEDLVIRSQEFREHESCVLLLGQFEGRGKASGVEMRSPVAWIFELRDRKIVRMQAYSSQQEALQAVARSN